MMESQQPQTQSQQQSGEDSVNCGTGTGKGGGGANFVCRQSSSRWTPTTDQIRILKDLYYNNGVRSPSAEQIQRISARLRQYGKIEGKNVFYWFQNHKARERQKKRYISDVPNPMHRSPPNVSPTAAAAWTTTATKQPDQDKYPPNIFPGVSSASSASAHGMVMSAPSVGEMVNYGCGSVTMGKSFMDCSISAGGSSGILSHNFGWDPYCSYDRKQNIFEEIMEHHQQDQLDEATAAAVSEIETLPLFPIHSEDIHGYNNLRPNSNSYYNNYSGSSWFRTTEDNCANTTASRTSLELRLNSYGRSPDSS